MLLLYFQAVPVQNLWENNDVVIYFLRRFGCPVCRWISNNLSSIKPILDENNVKLVGVGPEENGSKQFFDDKVFDGGWPIFFIIIISVEMRHTI